MRLRLKQGYERAQKWVEHAEGELKEVEASAASKDLASAKTSLKRAQAEVKEYRPKAIDTRAKEDKERNVRRSPGRVVEPAELGDKAAPFTNYGKNYTSDQLHAMYQRVGRYALGLPSFGPNILRTVHATTVMTLCYQMGINVDDQMVKDHFALARHGEYEMQRSYNLIKNENADYNPSCFSARVAGVIGAQDLVARKERPDFRTVQTKALNECLGDCLFDGLKRQEGESSLETMMREMLERMTQVFEMRSGGFSTHHIQGNAETIELKTRLENEKLRLEIAETQAKRQGIERTGELGIGQSLEVGRKRGLSESAGKCIPSVDGAGQPNRKRVKRGTYTADLMPLLLRMNAIFKENVVEMKLDPNKMYPLRSMERSVYHVTTFGGLCKPEVRAFMEAKVEKEGPSRRDVDEFYRLFPDSSKEKRTRDVVKLAKKAGHTTEWSDWLLACRKCKKVECGCPNQWS